MEKGITRSKNGKRRKQVGIKTLKDPKAANNTMDSTIGNLIEEIKEKGILAIAHESEEKQTMITNWAQDILDRYETALENQPTKIKSIVELPASKEEVKMAIKILLITYFLRRSQKMVDRLKEQYISIGAFQNINLKDGYKIVELVHDNEQELETAYSSVFPEYHKYMEVIISEQNVLLDDVNNFIHDLKKLRQNT